MNKTWVNDYQIISQYLQNKFPLIPFCPESEGLEYLTLSLSKVEYENTQVVKTYANSGEVQTLHLTLQYFINTSSKWDCHLLLLSNGRKIAKSLRAPLESLPNPHIDKVNFSVNTIATEMGATAFQGRMDIDFYIIGTYADT